MASYGNLPTARWEKTHPPNTKDSWHQGSGNCLQAIEMIHLRTEFVKVTSPSHISNQIVGATL